jgi:hypothetical protein
LRAAGVLTALALVACSSSSGGVQSSNSNDMPTSGGINFPSTGNQYVDARKCPACHQGSNPQQTGFMSGALAPVAGQPTGVTLYGPNLTPDPTTGIGNWTDSQLTNAILNGIDNQGERLCPEMGHFPDMQPGEVTSILGYLHSLKPVVHQASPSICPPLKQAVPGGTGAPAPDGG